MDRLTAVAYYGGIPPNNSNPEKPQILDFFIEGVRKVGDVGIDHRQMSVIPCDIALIQGFVHEQGKTLPHLTLRKQAIDLQRQNKKRSLIVDSNLFLYADPENSKRYLRYSFDGVFPTTGFYFDKIIDPQRWNTISANLNISLKDWRKNGNHILICLQRLGGWSMKGLDSTVWLDSVIKSIRKYSDRSIVVRPHPNDKKIKAVLKVKHHKVTISNRPNIKEDLFNAWATVVYNSSPSVVSNIEGVPVFLTDPEPRNSQSSDVSNIDISLIENPMMLDRSQWIEKISMCHWNFEELRSGEAWNFFKQFI
jgi:hypothetical protein